MKIAVILSLLFSLSQAASIAQDEPVFCHDLDCPKYTLVAKKTGYKIRYCAPSKWVGGTFNGSSYNKVEPHGFDLLFEYISGTYSAKEKIPMASPVATEIVPSPGSIVLVRKITQFYSSLPLHTKPIRQSQLILNLGWCPCQP